MSDTTVAPQGSAPPAAPTNSEVTIDQSPAASPQPLSNQAPDRNDRVSEKLGDHRPESRRESIQRAFERANNPPPKGERAAPRPPPKPAEARSGHNNPPEATEGRNETEGIDLKKRPGDQPQKERGERGRFVSQQDERHGEIRRGHFDAQARSGQLPEHAAYRNPPSRFSERAKIDWHAAPETVRADIHRMQGEFAKAYQFYKGDHDAMKPIRHFHEMAKSHGTTLDRALNNYVSMEQKLRADPIGGLDVIVNNLNLRTPEGQKLTLRDIAYYVLQQSPDQLKMIQSQNVQQAASHQIGALHQELAGMKNHLQKMYQQQQFTYTRSAVDQFAESHPRFDELGDLIENELKLGFDLDTAYRRAELLRPTTHAAQTRTSTSAQTRTADKSISGAPDVTPSNGASRHQKPVGRREAIQNAIRRSGL